MTTPAHVPVTAWTYPAPCGAPGVQLIPCCDASTCTSRHVSAPRQFYSRPNAVGIGPYHCPPYRHHHHHSRHRLPTPSLSSVPVPLPGSVYQPHHLPSSSVVAPPSVFSSQQQGPTSQTVYRRQQVSHNVYRPSALLNRSQQVRLCVVCCFVGRQCVTAAIFYENSRGLTMPRMHRKREDLIPLFVGMLC